MDTSQAPPLFELVNTLYNGVMDHAPKTFQEHPKACAAMLATLGTYGVLKTAQWLSRNVVDRVKEGFDDEVMPNIEKACLGIMAVAPAVYAATNGQELMNLPNEHPVYLTGMLATYVTSICVAAADLRHRKMLEKEDYEGRF